MLRRRVVKRLVRASRVKERQCRAESLSKCGRGLYRVITTAACRQWEQEWT